jgi:hypothetical protein
MSVCVIKRLLRRMFRIRRGSVSAKKVSKLFRFFVKSKNDLDASSHVCASLELKKPESYNLQARLVANSRMHEIESQKAMIISLSRHEKWKAGGPC